MQEPHSTKHAAGILRRRVTSIIITPCWYSPLKLIYFGGGVSALSYSPHHQGLALRISPAAKILDWLSGSPLCFHVSPAVKLRPKAAAVTGLAQKPAAISTSWVSSILALPLWEPCSCALFWGLSEPPVIKLCSVYPAFPVCKNFVTVV